MILLLLLLLMLPVQADNAWNPNGPLTGSYRFYLNDISSGGGTVDITAQSKQFFLYDIRENNHYFSVNMVGYKDKSGLYIYEKYGEYGQMKGSTTYRCKQISSRQYYCLGIKNTECQGDKQCYDVGTCYLIKQGEV